MFPDCADDVLRLIGGAFQAAFNDSVLGPRLSRSKLTVRFGLVDPDCVLYVDTENQVVSLGTPKAGQPATMVAMSANDANMYCQGKLNLISALGEGAVAAVGTIGDLSELMALADDGALPRVYRDVLRREGRQDILAA